MPRRTSSRTRSVKKRTVSKSKRTMPILPWQWKPLSPERRVDLFGGILALFGLVLFISMIGGKGAVTQAVAEFFHRIAGYGAFLVPLIMFLVGLWMILRRVERLPKFSGGRIFDIILLALGIFGFLCIVGGVEAGGILGFLGLLFVKWFGVAGAVVIWLGYMMIAISITFSLSIAELARAIRDRYEKRNRGEAPEKRQGEKPFTPSGEPNQPTLAPLGEELHPLRTDDKPRRLPIVQPEIKPLQATLENKPSPQQNGGRKPVINEPANGAADASVRTARRWGLPSVEDILDPPVEVIIQGSVDKDRARVIEETLKSFSAPVRVVDIQRGPAVTLFGVEPEYIETRSGRTRVRVNEIAALEKDLALALAASRIRIQAPVPGKGYVGIEVPNLTTAIVTLREVLESESSRKIKSPLKIALGKDSAGKPVAADLAAMPHLLIAGTTGSGKSVCVNALLCALLMNNTPDEVRLILIDPKRVELTGYNGIPHLMAPVVVDAEKSIGALRWATGEMDVRYKKFFAEKVRNIEEYNRSHPERMPFIIVVIDELADLMMLAREETERNVVRLAQLARATGIHLVIATQRPSVDVLTGTIKANLPARIAFSVTSNTDSRVILDQPGAEKLLGRGDMLYQSPTASSPVRLQGTYVSDQEILRLVENWRTAQNHLGGVEQIPDMALMPKGIPMKQTALFDSDTLSGDDPLLEEAMEIVRREKRASISMLQRKMRIGYTRAARIVDRLEEMGVIGPAAANSQVREVFEPGETEEIRTDEDTGQDM